MADVAANDRDHERRDISEDLARSRSRASLGDGGAEKLLAIRDLLRIVGLLERWQLVRDLLVNGEIRVGTVAKSFHGGRRGIHGRLCAGRRDHDHRQETSGPRDRALPRKKLHEDG